jgi:hypothetical protein
MLVDMFWKFRAIPEKEEKRRERLRNVARIIGKVKTVWLMAAKLDINHFKVISGRCFNCIDLYNVD